MSDKPEFDFCSLCNVRLGSSAVSVSHYNGQMHKKKLTNPVTTPPPVHRCEVCNVSCTGEIPFEAHMKSKKHYNKISGGPLLAGGTVADNSAETENEQNNDQEFPLWCDVCWKAYTNQLQAKIHFLSESHKRKLTILEEIKGGEISPLHCVTCVIKCLDENQIAAHMSSENHRKRLEEKQENEHPVRKKFKNKETVDSNDDGTLQNSAPPTVYDYCALCDVKLLTASQHTLHINGQKHKKKLEKPASAPVLINCDLCNVSCTGKVPFEAHLKSNKHLRRISKMAMQNEPSNDLSDNVQPSTRSDSNLLQNSFVSTIQVQREISATPQVEKEDQQPNMSEENDHAGGSVSEEIGGSATKEINTISDDTVHGQEENVKIVQKKDNEKPGTFKNSFVPEASKIVNQSTGVAEPSRRSRENEKQMLDKIDHDRHSTAEEAKKQIEKGKKIEKKEEVKLGSFKNSFVPEAPRQQESTIASQSPKSSRENDKHISDKQDHIRSSAVEEKESQEDSSKKSKRSKRSSLSCELCPVKGLDEKQMAAHLADHKKQLQDKKSHSKEATPTRSLRKRKSESGGASSDDAKVMKVHERDS